MSGFTRTQHFRIVLALMALSLALALVGAIPHTLPGVRAAAPDPGPVPAIAAPGGVAPPEALIREAADAGQTLVERPDLRWRTGSVYEVRDEESRLVTTKAVVHGKSIHYEPDGPGTGDWTAIDPTLQPVAGGWQAGENAFISALADDYGDPWPVSIQRRGPGGFRLRYRVAALGHVAQDRALTLLEEAGGSPGQVAGAEVVYADVFPGVILRYRVDHDYLKQTIEISPEARERLRQAVAGGGLDADGWLAVGVRLNGAELAGWRLGLGEGEETEGPIAIEKPAGWVHEAADHLGPPPSTTNRITTRQS